MSFWQNSIPLPTKELKHFTLQLQVNSYGEMKYFKKWSGNISFDSVWKNQQPPLQRNKQSNPTPRKKKQNIKHQKLKQNNRKPQTNIPNLKFLINLVHITVTKPKMKLQKQFNKKTASRAFLNSWSELKEINLHTKAGLSLATIFRKEKAQLREEFCISNCFWGKRHIYTDNTHLASCPWPYVSSSGASSLVSILK